MPWAVHTTADSLFSARTPGAFRTFDNGTSTFSFAFDTTSASSYYIISDTLSKYTWYKNDSLFWQETTKRYTGRDSLIKTTDILHNDQPAKELLIKEDISYKRMRLVQHDDKVYEAMVTGDMDLVYHPDATAFLNSFRIHTPLQDRNFLTRSKAAMLLQDLGSKDSVVRSEAFRYLNDVSFEKNDVPLLHQALLKQYLNPYANVESDYINTEIASELGMIADTATITFIQNNYPTFTNEKTFLKNPALLTLAGLHTKESYTAMAQLLEQYGPPATAMDFQTLRALKDSMPLTAPIFATFQKLAKDSAHSPFLAALTIALKDSGYIKQEQLAGVQNDYIQAAKKLQPTIKKGEIEYYIIDDLMQLIGSFNTTAGNAVLRSYLSAKDLYIKKEAVLLLAKNKQPVPEPVLLKLAADASIRSQLYDQLKELKKTALFPKQYATQQYFAEAAVHEVASYDYTVQKITFLARKTANYKGKPYTFYLYRVVLEDDDEAGYLGIAGGYKPGSTSLTAAEDISGIYWTETYTAGKTNVFFKDFIKSMEKVAEGTNY